MWKDIRDYYPKFTIFLGKEHDPDIQCEGVSVVHSGYSLCSPTGTTVQTCKEHTSTLLPHCFQHLVEVIQYLKAQKFSAQINYKLTSVNTKFIFNRDIVNIFLNLASGS